jgi:pyruvate kinase
MNFGLKKGVDMIAMSFVRRAEDIDCLRDLIGPRGAHIKIIAKIENKEGLNNFAEIL